MTTPTIASGTGADDLPYVVSEGTVKIGDIEMKVFQLSNGERVVDGDSVREILSALFGDNP